MKISTIISAILFFRLCPVKRLPDWSFKLNLLDLRVILHTVLYVGAVGTYFTLDIMDIMKESNWSAKTVIILVFKIITLISAVPAFQGLAGYVLFKMSKVLVKYSENRLTYWMFSLYVSIALAFYVGILPLEWKFLSMDWRDVCEFTAFTILVIESGLALLTVILVQEICFKIMKDVTNQKLLKKKISVEDLIEVETTWETISSAQGLYLFLLLSLTQILLILALYVFVKEASMENAPLLIAASSAFVANVVICYELENIYSNISEIADVARLQALDYSNIREMTRMKTYAARITANIPLSAMGYIEIDNSSITAMIGTTITYLVILIAY